MRRCSAQTGLSFSRLQDLAPTPVPSYDINLYPRRTCLAYMHFSYLCSTFVLFSPGGKLCLVSGKWYNNSHWASSKNEPRNQLERVLRSPASNSQFQQRNLPPPLKSSATLSGSSALRNSNADLCPCSLPGKNSSA